METLPRILLATAISLASAGSAKALNLNAGGLGQVLIYPYYTVNRTQQTLVAVTNTTNRVKAVKVRFIEGRNSKPVLDFNLYLSPFDVWTGAVFATGAAGAAVLATSDTSCTVPRIVSTLPFIDSQYTGANQDWEVSSTAPSLSSLLGSIERTREGHIELIEMGSLQIGSGLSQLGEEATHNSSGIPANCQAIVNAWSGSAGAWVTNSAASVDQPAGGLYGAAQIVDVANGTLQSYRADAIEGFYTNAATPGFLHRAPGSFAPDLGDADNGDGLIQVLIQTGNGSFVTQTVPTQQKTRSTTLPYSYDAVSLLYMRDAIYNEFTTEPSLRAASEWVLTMPTKGAYVDVATRTEVRAPFTDAFGDDGRACEGLWITYWNREERDIGMSGGSVDFSPPPPSGSSNVPSVCASAQVVAINQVAVATGAPSAILGGSYPLGIRMFNIFGAPYSSGWMRIVFNNPLLVGPENVLDNSLNQPNGIALAGLPVTGFWAVSYTNPNAQPGLLAQFGGAIGHRWSQQEAEPAFP